MGLCCAQPVKQLALGDYVSSERDEKRKNGRVNYEHCIILSDAVPVGSLLEQT